ncbi:hypothetical protein ACHAXT_005740 [Thalassiosira profunda]
MASPSPSPRRQPMTQSPNANENGSPRSELEVQTAPLLFPRGSPRRSPVSQSSANANSKLKRLAPAAIFLAAFIVAAVDNIRLRSDNIRLRSGGNYSRASVTDRSPRVGGNYSQTYLSYRGVAHNSQATRRAYSILPRAIFSVIGLESSGTQFVSKIIEDALATNSQYKYRGPYREGSAPCMEMCTDESDECLVKKSIAEGHECVETNDIQVQHFSLPWGGSCQEHPNPPVVDVVLPPQCARNQTSLTEREECSAMAEDLWNVQLDGRAIKYPTRYQLDIVKSKEWHDAHGVEQVFVIVVRDDKISFAARSSSHCTDTKLRQQEEDVGMQIIVNAINKYILKDDRAEALSQATLQPWVAKQYQGEGGMRRRLSAIPSNDGVVVVSYESLVKLGPAYVRMMYQALGIVSDFMPDVKDSNAKYLKDSKEPAKGWWN